MATGSAIVITPDPKGRFLEGTVSGTPKPGTCMEFTSAAEVGGRGTWQVYQPGTDGEQRLIAVLLPDELSGQTATQAYVTGARCFMYCPLPGDELNMLLLDIAGTADDHTRGEVLMVDTGTGKLIATTGSPESEAFRLMETVTDPAADTLARCMFTGY